MAARIVAGSRHVAARIVAGPRHVVARIVAGPRHVVARIVAAARIVVAGPVAARPFQPASFVAHSGPAHHAHASAVHVRARQAGARADEVHTGHVRAHDTGQTAAHLARDVGAQQAHTHQARSHQARSDNTRALYTRAYQAHTL